ncbi:hypothetical protein FRC03_002941 [Tulasnella sp. 419]|nr:hypothetical protein FRC03_002941 [Tulasnella sp. 419]
MAVSETADIRMSAPSGQGLSFQFPPCGIYSGAYKDVGSSLRILSEVSTLKMEGNTWQGSGLSKELLHFLATPFDLEDGEGAQWVMPKLSILKIGWTISLRKLPSFLKMRYGKKSFTYMPLEGHTNPALSPGGENHQWRER